MDVVPAWVVRVPGDPAWPCDVTTMAVPPPAAISAAANAAAVLRLNASGTITRPANGSRGQRLCCTD